MLNQDVQHLKLDRQAIANRSDFAVIPVEDFNPTKFRDFSEDIEATLGANILKGVVFDRDYRSDEEIKKHKKDFDKFYEFFMPMKGKRLRIAWLFRQCLTRQSIKVRLRINFLAKGEHP